jgi:hypothetical protein
MEMNKRDQASIRTALGRGAFLAQKSKDPVALVAACDQLMTHKLYEIELPAGAGVGAGARVKLADLLDAAMKVAPHLPHPILMSLLLAERQKDPKRFGDSADTLLSLGWPGVDETWRAGIRARSNAMAKQLNEEGRNREAKDLLDRLPMIEARDLVVRLSWSGDAMLDLVVDEPAGFSVDHFNPRSVFGGALVKEGRGKDREAVYVCPRGFDGEYTVHVNVLYNDATKPARIATLEIITHDGAAEEKVTAKTLSLSKLEPVRVTLTGGHRKLALPYFAPATATTTAKPATAKPAKPAAAPPVPAATQPRPKP